MAKIATLEISKKDAMEMFCSVERLCANRNDENGALQKLIEWLKQEEGGDKFKMKVGKVQRLRFGSPSDDFVLLYYFNGKRYKVRKDGKAFVSSADAEDTCDRIEESLQAVIDTILNDELRKCIGRAVVQNGGKLAKAKARDVEDGIRTDMIVGIVGPENAQSQQ